MRIDRSHLPWVMFVLLATIAATCLYTANFHPQRVPAWVDLPDFLGPVPPTRLSAGGTPLGLIFGSIAFLIFLFASALGIRKKRHLWPMRRVEWWLKAHIWLTVLTLPLVLFHCGFRAGGAHTTWLLVLYGIVMVSGVLGAALQHSMPRVMKERLPREVVFEQIPYFRSVLVDSAAKFREAMKEFEPKSADAPTETTSARRSAILTESEADRDSARVLIKFLDEQCLPYLSAKRGTHHRLGGVAASSDTFRMIHLNVSERWRPEVEKLESWCAERRRMDLQVKFHHWLHGWLLIHVPASFALLIFTAWHGWVAIRFLILQP